MAYSKLHSSIVNSSLWTESDPVRILFITMLAIADREGAVYGSRSGISRIANIRKEDTDTSFDTLMAPDKNSCDRMRAPENEGRRIEEISGGFRLLNYEYYRGLRNDDDRREQNKIAQKNYRERHSKSAAVSHDKPESASVSHDKPRSAHAEAEAETDTKTKPSAKRARGFVSNSQMSKTMGDKRHVRLQQIIMGWYEDWAGAQCPWNGAEGKQLKTLIDSTPRWMDSQFVTCLDNLAKSPDYIPKGSSPHEWLAKLPKFLNSPLDRFGRPIEKKQNTKPATPVTNAAADAELRRQGVIK